MKLVYSLTLNDWKSAIRLHMSRKLGRRIHLAIYRFLIPILAALGLGYILIAFSNGQTDVSDAFVGAVAGLIALTILLPIVRELRIRKSFKGMLPFSGTGPGYSLDLNNECIISSRPGIGEARYVWSGICGIAQSDKVILLYLSEILFIPIPTHALSADLRTELNELIARNVTRNNH